MQVGGAGDEDAMHVRCWGHRPEETGTLTLFDNTDKIRKEKRKTVFIDEDWVLLCQALCTNKMEKKHGRQCTKGLKKCAGR